MMVAIKTPRLLKYTEKYPFYHWEYRWDLLHFFVFYLKIAVCQTPNVGFVVFEKKTIPFVDNLYKIAYISCSGV